MKTAMQDVINNIRTRAKNLENKNISSAENITTENNVIDHRIPLICSITYSKTEKVNMGNYESKDYFVSATVQFLRSEESGEEIFKQTRNWVNKKVAESRVIDMKN